MIVDKPDEYLFSSARNYAELPSLLNIILETPQLKTYEQDIDLQLYSAHGLQIRASGNNKLEAWFAIFQKNNNVAYFIIPDTSYHAKPEFFRLQYNHHNPYAYQ